MKYAQRICQQDHKHGCVERQRQRTAQNIQRKAGQSMKPAIGTVCAVTKQADVIIQRKRIDHIPVRASFAKADDQRQDQWNDQQIQSSTQWLGAPAMSLAQICFREVV